MTEVFIYNINVASIFLGSFGRRASDGGANLHIYYPATGTVVGPAQGQQMDTAGYYINPNCGTDPLAVQELSPLNEQSVAQMQCCQENATGECNEELQRLTWIYISFLGTW